MGCGNSNSIENVKVKESVSNKNKPFLNHSYFIMENEKQVKDNYIIKNKLGEGASGVVRRIVDKTTGEEKALKILPKLSANKE